MERLTQNEKIIWSVWEEKSQRDVVREAAAKGTYINLAVKYLMAKNGWNETTAQDWFMAEVSLLCYISGLKLYKKRNDHLLILIGCFAECIRHI